MSKSKIRETQNEIENLQAIDQGVRFRYREIMESLRTDLLTNEKECKKLQERIEWVSRRRAEIREEVKIYEQNLLTVDIAKMTEQPPLEISVPIKQKLKRTPSVKSVSPKVSEDIPLTIIMSQEDIENNVSSVNYNRDSKTKHKTKDKPDKPEDQRKGGGKKTDQSRPPSHTSNAGSITRSYYGAFRH